MAKVEKYDVHTLRRAAFSIGIVLAVISLWPLLRHGGGIYLFPAVVAALLVLTAVTAPKYLSGPYHYWMIAGRTIGYYKTKILLLGLYFLVLCPVSLAMKLFKSCPVETKIDKDKKSYLSKIVCNSTTSFKSQY